MSLRTLAFDGAERLKQNTSMTKEKVAMPRSPDIAAWSKRQLPHSNRTHFASGASQQSCSDLNESADTCIRWRRTFKAKYVDDERESSDATFARHRRMVETAVTAFESHAFCFGCFATELQRLE